MDDFYEVCADIGFKIVFNEMGFEYISLSGTNLPEIAESYASYTFSRSIKFRINRLKEEISKRKCMGLIHYHQYACHHTLEDNIIRQEFDNHFLTLQGDLPRRCDGQIKLRLEAFYESI